MQNVNPDKPGSGFLNRTWSEWLFTFPVFVLLILTLTIGTLEMIHGQLLKVGESLYGDESKGIQYSMLRGGVPATPDCERHPNIDQKVQEQLAAAKNDPMADLFGAPNPDEIRQSLLGAQAVCEDKYKFYENVKGYIEENPGVNVFRKIETAFTLVFDFGTKNRPLILVIMVVIAAIQATLGKHHIGLRPAVTKIDHLVQDTAMLFANALLTFSCIKYLISMKASGVAVDTVVLVINYLWTACFAALTVINALKLAKPPAPKKEGGNFGLALLSIPLYAHMAIISGIAFIFFMDYSVGQAIYLGQLAEFANIFLNLALFIWVGMLLTQTRVMDLFLNILRPWNFSPETLTWLILIAAAIPTAYTGASGIFVVAAGAIIYKEVWNSGARRQYALAVSAMSGSLGVVVRPCLLVVLIAMLDSKHVTSDELFDHGIYVFWLTAFMFLAVSLFLAETKFRIAPAKVAVPGMMRAFVPVIPYVIITCIILFFYEYMLKVGMNENSAPIILPFIMLAIVAYDKMRREKEEAPVYAGVPLAPNPANDPIASHEALEKAHEEESPYLRTHDPHGKDRRLGFEAAIRFATNETIGHIGALIILMALSVSVGGLIERTEIVHLLPSDIGSIYVSLIFIALLLAFIGMCTDPFGAVILVAATVAPVAYHNGIHPIHFWMICLVAFELGYVTPPVALNHLLTRMSVGDDEVAAADAEAKSKYKSFYFRYERWILPPMVMFPALLIVTYAPYVFKMFGWYD